MALFALLVGIDRYRPPIHPLRGCAADIAAAAGALRAAAGPGRDTHVVTLVNEHATRAAVIEAIRAHLGRAGRDDSALLWFSGHGSTAALPRRLWHTEADGRMQTLLCVDSRHDGVPDLYDRELALLLSEVTTRGAHTAVIIDACHAESATRDGGEWPAAATVRRHPESGGPPPAGALLPELGESPRHGDQAHVELAACHSFQAAHELPLPGVGPRGLFSHGLIQALDRLGGGATARELLAAARRFVEDTLDGQAPRLHPIHDEIADRPLLGGPACPPLVPMTMRYVHGGWEIDAGACHGLRAEPDGGPHVGVPGSNPPRVARVIRVLTERSTVAPVGWTPDPERQYAVALLPLPTDPAARWHEIRDLANPHSALAGAVRLTVAPAYPGPGGVLRLRCHRGPPRVVIRLHNTTGRRLYAAILHLTEDFGVHSGLFPGGFIAPGWTVACRRGEEIEMGLPRGPGSVVQEWLLLVVAEAEFSVMPFTGTVHRDLGPGGQPTSDWATTLVPLVTEHRES